MLRHHQKSINKMLKTIPMRGMLALLVSSTPVNLSNVDRQATQDSFDIPTVSLYQTLEARI
ncbi:hypothetical protein [Merismopedia glauca]|uniref:Uncharacterized protein n=1 Tax=Merismopedia glauca CCAP 1448/3 TaxID=1296344 RepID=A0A2T1C5B8_9CYAN|nr:hypothetical protein [Merismopedia glauca]PSB03472.1 hypothetical protein C7B64_08265 [Merismopedia glauca CCAP 1448/3]